MSPARRAFWSVVGAVVALTASEPAARAEAPGSDAERKARAGALWREGRALRDQQRHPEACVKFRQSLSEMRSPGTLLNVGACFVLENEPEQAHATFQEVLQAATLEESAKRTAFIEAAQKEIDALEQQLARVAIRFSPTAGLEIRLTDESRGRARLIEPAESNRLLLKPGPYRLLATAAGHEPFSRNFTATAGQPASLTIPPLQPLPVAPPPPVEPAVVGPSPEPAASFSEPAAPEVEQGSSALPWVLTGGGAALLSAGIVTGILAADKGRELEENCEAPDYRCPSQMEDPGWQDKIDAAGRLSIVTDVLWGAGLVSIGVGVALLIIDDDVDADATETRVDAGCLGASCGVTLQGRF